MRRDLWRSARWWAALLAAFWAVPAMADGVPETAIGPWARNLRQELEALPRVFRPDLGREWLRLVRTQVRLARPEAARVGEHRVVHYAGDVRIDPTTRQMQSDLRVRILFVDAGTTAVDLLAFLPLTGVEDPDGTPLAWTTQNIQGYDVPRIPVDPPSEAGETRDFTVHLQGVPDCSMSGPISVNLCGFGKTAYIAGEMLLPTSLQRDFATMELDVHLPAGLVLVGTGIVTAVTPEVDGQEVHHLRQDFPTDSHSFGLAPYQVARLPWGTGHLGTYTLNDSRIQSGIAEVLTDIRDVLQYYGSRFGPFLFPKMEACQVGNDAGAAFGWPALLWIPDGMWRDRGSSRTALFAHELGHQWFPDILQNDDSFGAWLSEGFAEFLSLSFVRDRRDLPDFARAHYDWYAQAYFYFVGEAQDYGLSSMDSVYVSSGWVYQVVTYYKGAIIANLLEQRVGREVFDQAIRDLYQDIGGKAIYYDTSGLKAYLERASGMNLDQEFSQWVWRKGYPILTVGVVRPEALGTPEVDVQVDQQSSTKFNEFRFPVTVRVVTDTGEQDHTVMVEPGSQSVRLPVEGRLTRVRIDPEGATLERVRSALPGDMDLSGEVDGIDLVYAAWAQGGSFGYTDNFLPSVDFDGNAVVDQRDLAVVTDHFGQTLAGGAR